MFLKLLGSLVLLIIAITEKYWGKEISKQIKYKKGIIALLVFSFLFSVITIIVDDISTNSTIENQKTSQIALLRKNDSLKYQLDSLIKIINENIGVDKFKDLAIQVYNNLNSETKSYLQLTDFLNEPHKRKLTKVGRNDLCPCGSGKKYKNCHWPN